jgi:tRNA dimethylallyltransferase
MMEKGFLEEVRGLLQKGYASELKAMKSLGYRHLTAVLEKGRDVNQALDELKRDTRHYAKRQITWLAKEPNLIWFSPEEFDKVRRTAMNFLE